MDVELLWRSYVEIGSVHRTGKIFDVSGDTVHQKLKKAGKELLKSMWSSEEIAKLKEIYSSPLGVSLLDAAAQIGRSVAAVACKADELSLTSKRGEYIRRAETFDTRSAAKKASILKLGHPRGMLGKKHTAKTRQTISEKGFGRIKPPESTLKAMKTKLQKYGSLAPAKPHGSWKAAWREIGGQRIYARSRWEANYARYLEAERVKGAIFKWEHEPHTFWFEAIKRGCRSYLPDFRVTFPDGSIEFHEVKGWMDARSKTKIKRMKKYHPTVALVLLDAKWFRKAQKDRLHLTIEGWEDKNDKSTICDPE